MHGIPTTIEDVAAVRDAIESIPPAMRNMGWHVSAEIMDRWIRSPAWVLPDVWKSENPPDPATLSPAHLDQSLVSMSWALTSPRVRMAMKKLRTSMANSPAKRILLDRVKRLPWGNSLRIDFGDIRDTYDFNGPQYLGTWDRTRVLKRRRWP
jgi:hypothetical protein